MSSRKNGLGGVGVTVVNLAAFRASPFSYSQLLQPARAAARTARRTGYGGIRFVDFLEQHARRNRLVLKHCSEHRPACIQDGFRHLGFRKAGSVHVANEDRTILFDEPGAEFVQEVFPAVRYLCVDCLHTLFLVCPLRDGECLLCTAIDALRFDLFTCGQRGEVLQTEVDTDRGCTFGLLFLDFDTEIGVPAPPRVLTEAARPQFVISEAVAVPQAEELPGVAKLPILV